MTFGPSWNNLLDNIDALPPDATLVTPLSRKPLGKPRADTVRDDDETIPLQQAQFETLYEPVSETGELREEIEEYEDKIAEMNEFRSGRSFHESPAGE